MIKGSKLTDAQKAKISAACKGKKRSAESCANIARATQKWWNERKEKESETA